MFASFRSIIKRIAAIGAVGALTILSPVAQAAPITHTSFGISGAFAIPGGTNLGSTNSITIKNGGHIIVTAPDTFDLSGLIHFGDGGILQNLPNLMAFTPIAGFLTLASGVSLDLNSLTIISRSGPTPGFLNMSGNAVLHAPGFDATSGVFSWSGTTTDNLSFTFAVTASAQTQPALAPTEPVPEPFSLGLLGVGLLGVSFGRRALKRG